MQNFSENIVHLENEDFDKNGKLLHGFQSPIVVMIQNSQCPHCKDAKPHYQNAANSVKGIVFATIQIDGGPSEQALGKRMPNIVSGIKGVPTFVLFDRLGNYKGTYDGPRDGKSISNWASSI